MAEEIAFENGRISYFEGLVTLDRVILHTIVQPSTNRRTDGHLRPALLGRLCRIVDLKFYHVMTKHHKHQQWNMRSSVKQSLTQRQYWRVS